MLLYHIERSRDTLSTERQTLEPYIPMSVMDDEDQKIPRICFAPSLALCFQSTGLTTTYPSGRPIPFFAYVIDMDDIPKHAVIDPEILWKTKLVPDALENKEYWITIPVIPKKFKFTVEMICREQVIAWSMLTPDMILDLCEHIGMNIIQMPWMYRTSPEYLFRYIIKNCTDLDKKIELEQTIQDEPRFITHQVTNLQINKIEREIRQ